MVACSLPKSLEHLILQQKRSEREDKQQEQFHRQTQAIYRILVHYMNVAYSFGYPEARKDEDYRK
jgi:hypothetical protein